jgi:hypothetical protein
MEHHQVGKGEGTSRIRGKEHGSKPMAGLDPAPEKSQKAISPEQHSAPMKLPAIPPHLPDGVEMFDGVDFGGAARFECII